MRSLRMMAAIVFATASIGFSAGISQAQLTRDAAEQRFSKMVREHLGKKSRGRAGCEAVRGSRYRCHGRWQRRIRNGNGSARIIVRARGGVFENTEMVRSKAQLTRWKIAGGVKRGPFKGAFLMSTSYKPL